MTVVDCTTGLLASVSSTPTLSGLMVINLAFAVPLSFLVNNQKYAGTLHSFNFRMVSKLDVSKNYQLPFELSLTIILIVKLAENFLARQL